MRPAVRAGERHSKRRGPNVSSLAFLRGSVRTTLPVESISLRPGNPRRSVLRAGSARYENVRPVQGSGAISTLGSVSIPFGRPFRNRSNQRRASGSTCASSAGRERGRGVPEIGEVEALRALEAREGDERLLEVEREVSPTLEQERRRRDLTEQLPRRRAAANACTPPRFRPASASFTIGSTSGAALAAIDCQKPSRTPERARSCGTSAAWRSVHVVATSIAANGTPSAAARQIAPPPYE